MQDSGDPIEQHSSNKSGGSGLRILIVDDDADIVECTAVMLELDGHEVQRALGGREALERIKPFSPHLALIDLAMPHVGGLDVARGVRGMNLLSQPTLAAMSGYGAPEHKRFCVEAGFDHYLVKPMDLTELSQVVQLATPSVRFEALQIKFNALAYSVVLRQLEYCELLLDWVAQAGDANALRRRVGMVLRIQLMAATWLQKQTDLPQDQRIQLGNQIASIGVRVTDLRENKKP